KDRYNRTGFIDQSEARATRQAPSIRVLHTGHAAHYILLLSRVLLWLAAFLSRMPLDCRETQDWLRSGGPTCLRPNPTPHCLPLRS
uniref:Transposase n=1 Tax=Mesocestoides corti TaxID=53468 RepID=A0A5K3FMC0_MESCO